LSPQILPAFFCAMTTDINKIFSPSTGVDIVFDINSLAPCSSASIIYDLDPEKKEIIIAQTQIPFSSSTQFKELHLTTILHDKNRKLRAGVECINFKLLEKYQLNNQTVVRAVLLKYKLPVVESNIRSAFRLPLSTKYTIKGKLSYNNFQYISPLDFTIKDISLVGLGIIISQKRNHKTNSLSSIKKNDNLTIALALINMDYNKPVGIIPVKAQVVRVNNKHSNSHSFIGLQFLNLKTNYETVLNKFIHKAQVEELKRLSRRNI
jgi:hypothetical protein